jgi:hypothetical protein
VPHGTPVVNALAKQRAMLENIMRACVGLPPDNNMVRMTASGRDCTATLHIHDFACVCDRPQVICLPDVYVQP